jgi:hypothetical protein
MTIQIRINNFVRYISTGRTEITSTPKVSPPISFTYLGKLLLNFSRRSTFCLLNKLTHGYVRRYRRKNVDVVRRQHAVDNLYTHFLCNLCNNFSNSQSQIALQYPIAVFGYPYQVISMVVAGMLSAAVFCHPRTISEDSPVWKTGVSTI